VLEKLNEAKKYLLSQCKSFPETVVVLGSGMATVLSEMQVEEEISFDQIPHVPGVTVQGHVGKLKIGKLDDRPIAVLQGRLHYYEGHSIQTVVFPFRAIALAGAKTFVLTNAAGGMNPSLKPASLLLVKDHINAMGVNPLTGPNIEELGPRFPDMTYLYDPEIRRIIQAAAKDLRIDLPQGVYVAIHGPSYETPAEIQMYRQWGGDVVGMSTVPEAIALHHMGRRVAAVSCITNMGAGLTGETMNHQEVLDNAKQTHSSLSALLRASIRMMGEAKHG